MVQLCLRTFICQKTQDWTLYYICWIKLGCRMNIKKEKSRYLLKFLVNGIFIVHAWRQIYADFGHFEMIKPDNRLILFFTSPTGADNFLSCFCFGNVYWFMKSTFKKNSFSNWMLQKPKIYPSPLNFSMTRRPACVHCYINK